MTEPGLLLAWVFLIKIVERQIKIIRLLLEEHSLKNMKKKIITTVCLLFLILPFFNIAKINNFIGQITASDNFYLKVEEAPGNPIGGEVVKGTRGLIMLKLKLSTGSEGVKIASLSFSVKDEKFRGLDKEDLKSFWLYSENQKLTQETNPKNGQINFSDLAIYIPHNTTKEFWLFGSLDENINLEKFRVAFDEAAINRSNILGQKSQLRPRIEGAAFGNLFSVSDELILITSPANDNVFRLGQSLQINWNNRFLVREIKLSLLCYDSKNELNPKLVIPIGSKELESSQSFGQFDYKIEDGLKGTIEKCNYFKIRASFQFPQNQNKEAFSSGFFQIKTNQVDLVRASGQSKVYQIVNGFKLWLPSDKAISDLGFQKNNIVEISQAELNNYKEAKLLKPKGDYRIYYRTNSGLKRLIPNEIVFNSYGNNWADVLIISQNQLNIYPDSFLIKLENDYRVYRLENNQKRWIETAAVFDRLGYDWNLIAPVNQAELGSYLQGNSIR